jgi:iron complex outermembrane recepter protein
MMPSRLALAAALAVLPSPVAAQAFQPGKTAAGGRGPTTVDSADTSAAGTTEAPTPGNAMDAHHDHGEEIVVTGIRRKANDVLGGISVLDEADLTREMRPSIGETLARQPGVSATSFGPTASAPVLRGLSGDRVRVLTDGIGSLDVSSSGPDHAVAINPLTADRIEVLRGPAALLFGSSAIGGVVNVIDRRIPRRLPDNAVGADAFSGFGSASSERVLNGAIDFRIAGPFTFHVDGNWTKTGDLRTGGHILSRELREEAAASPDPDIRALAELRGDLPNSASETKEGAVGLAYVDGGLNVGASITRRRSRYEVPIRYSLEPGVEAEAPTIDQEQTRYDFRAEVPVSGFFTQVRGRAGYARYHHDELEETGEVGSSFFSKGGEGRVELVQSDRSGWGGTSGLQYLDRNAKIRGDEKFLPDSEQRQAGLFTLQTFVNGPLRVEGGARVEFSKLGADADELLETPALSRNFATWSASFGGKYELLPGWRAGLTVSRSSRAPSIDELFANGPHGGSQAFEIGDPDLDPETSLSVEAALTGDAGPVTVTVNAYYSHFSNFIFQAPTGEIEDDLPVFETRQGRADYYGFEAQALGKFGEALGIHWKGELQADMVRATVKDFGPAPFIPPFRILAAVEGSHGPVDGRVEIEHAFGHDRTAPIETETPSYTLVNASVDWHVYSASPELTLSVAANNLFDVEARRSTSMLKDFAPLGGRDFRLTARVGF